MTNANSLTVLKSIKYKNPSYKYKKLPQCRSQPNDFINPAVGNT